MNLRMKLGVVIAFVALDVWCMPLLGQQGPKTTFPELKPKTTAGVSASAKAPSLGEQAPVGEDDSSFALKRHEWFMQQRAYPFAHIPSGARAQALQQYFKLKAQGTHGLMAVPATANGVSPVASFTSLTWNFDGPASISAGSGQTPYSGRATSLAIDPSNAQTMYLGTAAGGVWKTTDGGQSWTPITDFQPSLAIGALAIDPNNPSIIYAGTGEANYAQDSYYGQGLLKSTDAGATWTQISTPFVNGATAAPFAQIAIQPGNSSVLLAATESGVYRSTDGGTTWTNELPSYASAVIFDPSNPNTAYAGMNGYYNSIVHTSLTAAIYKSTDGGVTWTAITGGSSSPLPAGSTVFRTALTLDSSGNLLAGLAPLPKFGSGNLYKSADGGTTWTALTAPGDGLDWYRDWIVSVPGSPNILYTGGVNLFQSLDGGLTWTQSTQSYPTELWADQHAAVFSPDGTKMYVMDDGGIFMTSSPTTSDPSFVSLNNSIGDMTFYPGFAITAGTPSGTLVGAQDHGTQIGASGSPWSYAGGGDICGDGGPVVLGAAGLYAYAHCQGSPLSSWMSSATGGAVLGQSYPYGWVSAQSGITTTDRTAWVPPIATDPSNANILYTGTYRVYQSLDYAQSWTPISGDLTAGSGTLNTIAVAPTNANVVYTGASDGTVYVTTNALAGTGATWTQISGLPNRSISKIVVAPDSPQDVYVTVNGFGSGHVFHSTDGGLTWADISGNLPNTPADSIAVDPSLQNTLYLATDTGVYVTSDGGTTWQVLGSNLPNVVVMDLLFQSNTRLLRVVTHGRGAWDVTLPLSGFVASTNLLKFGSVAVNSTSSAQTVTLTNDLSTSVAISSISTSGAYAETNNCGSSLSSGANCIVNVTFAPTTSGNSNGSLAISSDQGNISVALTGSGTTAVMPTVTVTPSASSITTSQSLLVSVTVAGGSGSATPTGSVDLTSGSYTSLSAPLSSGAATISIPAGSLAAGTDTLSVAYTPDASSAPTYSTATGTASVTVSSSLSTPTVSVMPSAASITTSQSLSVSVTVVGASGAATPTGSVTLTSGSYSSAATTLSSGAATISIPAGSLATGTDTLSVAYTPDSTSSSIYNSATGTATVTVSAQLASTPTFSPAGGTYTSVQSVTISDATSGASIYYTTDGSTPTSTSTPYTGPITVSTTETIQAIALASGYSASAVGSASYTINLPAAATPTFSPAAGIYSSTQNVTISDTTSSSTIYYTTDGSTPTTSSQVYSSPISVASSETVKAIAEASGYSASPVAKAAYTIGTPFTLTGPSGSAASQTVSAGGSATYNFSIAPAGSTTIPAKITFQATGLPIGATATFTPSSIPAGSGSKTVQMKIQTSSTAAMFAISGGTMTLAICMFSPFIGLRRRSWSKYFGARKARMLLAALLLLGASVGMTACGGGSSGSNGTSGSTSQTYNITVTATCGNTNQTAKVTLVVQ